MAYATKADIESGLGKAFTIPANYLANSNALLNIAIQRAASKIDTFTGKHWEPLTRYLVLDGDNTDMLSMLQCTTWSANKVLEISERLSISYAFETGGVVLSPDAYVLDASGRFIRRIDGHVWARGHLNYRAECDFGQSTAPPQIKEATILLVRHEIEPGHIDDWMPMYSERFPDGYSYVRGIEIQHKGRAATQNSTGHSLVDGILTPHIAMLQISMVGL